MEDQDKALRVAVVGGGIAGLTLAVGLVKQIEMHGANISLQLYEQAPAFAEIGAGVALGPNALKSLEILGLEEQMKLLGGCPEETKSTWFEFRHAENAHPECGELITTITGDRAGQGSVHRAHFLDSLVEAVPPKYCKFDHRVVDFTQGSDSVTLSFANGNTANVDLVLACDGIKSPLRKALYKNLGIDKTAPQEKYAEWIAWRGLIPAETYETATDRPSKMPIMWLGSDRHILTFPVKRGAMVNLVGFVRDPERKKINGQTAPWAENRPVEEMLEDFNGYNDGCIKLLKSITQPSVWGIFELPPLNVVHGDGIILVGDAGHATTPHQGAGAGQAIEDALFLSHLLGLPAVCASPSRAKLTVASEIYRQYRQERAARVQKTSREAGLLYEGHGIAGEGDSTPSLKRNLDERMKWIWGYDIEGQLSKMLDEVEAAISSAPALCCN